MVQHKKQYKNTNIESVRDKNRVNIPLYLQIFKMLACAHTIVESKLFPYPRFLNIVYPSLSMFIYVQNRLEGISNCFIFKTSKSEK